MVSKFSDESKHLNKSILSLAIPNIISNISVPLLSSVDTAVVGHLDQVSYLGAIALGSMIFNFIYWAFGFLRMGTTGLTAQAHGRSDEQESFNVLLRALSVAVGGAIVLLIFQEVIGYVSFLLINSNSEVELLAREYFDIRIYAAPATLSVYVFHGWFLGKQNARIPMIIVILINILNIGFNLLFIYQFDMKSNGVALGTVCAQYIGLIISVIFYFRSFHNKNLLIKLNRIFDLKAISNFFKINFDIFVRTLLLVFTFTYFTAESAAYGENILAANTILLQLWMLLSYGIDGFAFASESLVGKAVGENNKYLLKKVIGYSFYWGMGLSVLYSMTYLIFGHSILSIYTDKLFLIELAGSFLIWTIIAPVINSVCYIWDGIYIGATQTQPMRNSMIVSSLIIFLPIYYLTNDLLGNHSLWMAMTIFMLSRGLFLSILSKKYILSKA